MSNEAEQNIQTWKIKKLIKSLDAARGCVLPLTRDREIDITQYRSDERLFSIVPALR